MTFSYNMSGGGNMGMISFRGNKKIETGVFGNNGKMRLRRYLLAKKEGQV